MNLTQTITQLLVAAAIIALGVFFFTFDCEGWKEVAAVVFAAALLFSGTIMVWSTIRPRGG